MKIRFCAHASFRLEADGLAVITDPYTPGPHNSGFDPIGEPADVVIMSSATDPFHSDPSHVRGDPIVVNALELPPEGAEVGSLHIRPFPAMESITFDFGRDPDANASYLFTLGGLRILHMGDIGNPVSQEHVDALRRNVDVLFALEDLLGRPARLKRGLTNLLTMFCASSGVALPEGNTKSVSRQDRQARPLSLPSRG